MSPFGNRGAADFARLLDSGAPAVSGSGLALVAQLRTAGAALDTAVAPRPEFRHALRQRLMAVATVQAGQATAPAGATSLTAAVSWRRRASTVAAGAMASVIAVSGVAVAGSQSLPGDPFYGVKRTTEAFQLRMADDGVEKGTRHLDFAATRLREVRGLTLGRDAVDAGPALGPAAMSGEVALRSATAPLGPAAAGSDVADRVRSTLADMDEQTREGSELLTRAYRSSRAAEPLRALSRFATRQSAGLEQLLPALPPATRTQARASLALLTDVSESTAELIRIGTCGTACDPTSAAPGLPAVPDAAASSPEAQAPADCECPQPAPAPNPQSSPLATSAPEPTSDPEPTRSPSPQPASPTPSPQPSGSSDPLPLPLPSLPLPLPTLPLPLPTITLPPVLDPLDPVLDPLLDPLLPGISGSSRSGSSPVPAPSPTPVPQLAPLPPRA